VLAGQTGFALFSHSLPIFSMAARAISRASYLVIGVHV
jgi:hypothetical protein